MKDFLSLRPMFHWTEERVRGHVALCVLAATIEAVMAQDLAKAKMMDPDLAFQSMTPRRALSLLKDVRLSSSPPATPHRACEPPQRRPVQGVKGPPSGHLNLVQGRNRLSRTFSSRVGKHLFAAPASTWDDAKLAPNSGLTAPVHFARPTRISSAFSDWEGS